MADTNTESPKVEEATSAMGTTEKGRTRNSETSNTTKLVDESTPVPPENPAATTATTEGASSPEQPSAPSTEKPTTAVAVVDKEPETETNKSVAPAAEEAAPPKPKTPFEEFDAKLPEILKEVGHDEMWGVKLVSPASSHVPTGIVIQKFLNANEGNLAPALDQFTGALKFRKEKKPLELVAQTFSAHKFADLGAVTVYPVKDSALPEVFTWNLYGNVKGKMDEVFVPLDEFVPSITADHVFLSLIVLCRFMDYRIALQELGIQQLKLSSATEPITAEKDPYKIFQVHDYKSISFLRQNTNVKAASTEVIKKFALAYPELLKVSKHLKTLATASRCHTYRGETTDYHHQQEKFFVNVPAIMGWMYAVIKVFIAANTAKKFHPMANGANLAAEFKASGIDESQLPKEYGGQGGSGDGKMKDIPGVVNELKFE